MSWVITRLSSLSNAVLPRSINIKVVLFSLKYLGKSFIYRVQSNPSSSASRHITSVFWHSHLNTHILQTVFLMHPFPFPSPTAKWQEDELQFLSPALCSPAQLSDQCQICLVPQAQMTVWLQLPKLLHCVIPLSLISFSMRLKPNIRGNKITDQWVYVHKDFGHPLFPQALILPSSIKSTQI